MFDNFVSFSLSHSIFDLFVQQSFWLHYLTIYKTDTVISRLQVTTGQ